ncbi:MAG: ABC transporter permease [Acidimicrobiia bacterium]|nr:ABC transporter permease [Acidimicrobiia bacterium]
MRYVAGRVVQGVLALFGFLTVMFFAVQVMVPGDYFTPLRMGMTEAEVDAIRAQYGLDQSLWIQYWRWMKSLFQGTLGTSTIGSPISGLLSEAVPRTLFVLVGGLLIAFAIGTAQGRWSSWSKGFRSDVITFIGLVFLTAFPPFLAFLLNQRVRQPLRDLRNQVMGDSANPWKSFTLFTESRILLEMTVSLVIGVAIAALVTSLLRRYSNARPRPWWTVVGGIGITLVWWWQGDRGVYALDLLFDSAIPLIAFILLSYGEFLLIMQSSMTGVEHEPYVLTGMAKGLTERQVRNRHASSNAILPLLARFAVSVPFLMTGLVIIERSVSWHGLGDFLFSAITAQDLPVVMGALAVIGVLSLLVRITLEVVTVTLDPRIRRP